MNESVPAKGAFAEPLMLPANGPDACTDVLRVLTLVVVPATGS
jgi:hypothetical protein